MFSNGILNGMCVFCNVFSMGMEFLNVCVLLNGMCVFCNGNGIVNDGFSFNVF